MTRRLGPLSLSCMLAVASGCGAPCRDIEARPLELTCDATQGFSGELHFDSQATFDTFLRQQCLPPGADDIAAGVLASVNFDAEAVFVAVRPHDLGPGRCLRARALDSAQVCATGLRLLFNDEVRTPGEVCPATRWTVAFALPRAELRAALEAAEEEAAEVGR